MSKIELTEEKSELIATIIKIIKPFVATIDVEYCRAAADQMNKDVMMQKSLSVLNPSFNFTLLDIKAKQADSLIHLADFVETMIETGKLKDRLSKEEAHKLTIQKLFQ